jgi:hypothetical protein
MATPQNARLISRRGELLAEMFLTDCGAKVTQAPFGRIDLLAFFESDHKAFQVAAVEVKAQETPLPHEFALDPAIIQRAAEFNIPTLLLVVDVKQNKLGFAWLDEFAKSHSHARRGSKVRIPLSDVEEHREQIRERLLATVAATT